MEDNERTVVKPDEEGGEKPIAKEADGQGKEGAEKPATSDAGTADKGSDEVPRRNAEYWKTQTERENARKARAEFFKTKHKVTDPETGQEHEEEAPLTRAEVSAMLERNKQDQEARDIEKADEISITQFLSKPENAKFSKYEAKARTYLKAHPYYPLSGVFRDLAYDDAVAEGAQRAAKAKDKNDRQQVKGNERRPATAGGMPNFSGMKPAERAAAFRSYKAKVRRGEASLTEDNEE